MKGTTTTTSSCYVVVNDVVALGMTLVMTIHNINLSFVHRGFPSRGLAGKR